jgi:regulator of extracellular matrix RemA (YlzA/DUF370 family)
MNNWLTLTDIGLIDGRRVVAVGLAESSPMKRLLTAVSEDRLIILTGGQRRQTVAILDSGHVIVTALTLTDWQRFLQSKNRNAEMR